MLRHIILFRIKDEVSNATRQQAIEELTKAGKGNPDIHEWLITESLDMRKGHIIIENSVFTDREAVERFRLSDAHAQAGELMSEIADWVVGDYWES